MRSALTRPPLRLTNRNDPCTSDICHVAAFDTPPHLPLFNPTFGRALSYLHFFFLLSRLSFCSFHKVCSSQALIHVSIHPSSPEWTVGESPSWATVALAKQRLPYKYVLLPPCHSLLLIPFLTIVYAQLLCWCVAVQAHDAQLIHCLTRSSYILTEVCNAPLVCFHADRRTCP